ncbi:MAG: holo-ACP synthase [Alphaproteobacteria bacterium]|nr:holo-ACP synthase [Alphaproteobacteria bacterium]
MILGLGSDLIDIRRIAESLERFGDRFTHRLFTEGERRRCDARAARAEGYARRFAAKEACSKALGTGFRRGVYWRDLEVVNLPSGQPTMRLAGEAAVHLRRLVPPGLTPVIHVSLTDDPPMAQAIVIISAVPETAAP